MLSSEEIREIYLHYFEKRGHARVPSSSLIPYGDPTLLFTNAGMVQFKDVFLGTERREYRRATSSQKCLRVSGKHNDLDAVGHTARHHTFFEMLGNFSFGDYFKQEAIAYAWELLTEDYGLPKESLWVTIYQEDEEAFRLWQEVAGVPADRIVRLGEKDNFWAMGDTGPCGPCSEVILDRGEAFRCQAPLCGIGRCDCDRYLELWNLVFMQFQRDASGRMTPLPKPSIDTGMGLERLTAVLQGVPTNWETDLFLPIIARLEELCSQSYIPDEAGFPFRVIADHARACTFLIADGVIPSNVGRGYVLRRLLRRAVRFGRSLGTKGAFLGPVAEAVIAKMGRVYPELQEKALFISRVLELEEARFNQTLALGLELLDQLTDQAHQKGALSLPGEAVFKLYDTYGFPKELTEEVAAERGLAVDQAGFEAAMAQQQERARAARKAAGTEEAWERWRQLGPWHGEFLGYRTLTATSRILAILHEGEPVDIAAAGQEVEMLLAETPFYAESGGQVGDRGVMRGPGGMMTVADTQSPVLGLIVHRGVIAEGYLAVGDEVEAEVDRQARLNTARNHTGTHLLHAALRRVLGTHVQQAGSLVAPNYLRFDFSHLAPLTPEELEALENLVNEKIKADLAVSTNLTSFQEAMARGALAFFGDKYGQEVRLVEIKGLPPSTPHFTHAGGAEGVFSAELCGGTHLAATGQVGLFRILSESSIGAGLRRVVAVTGREAERLVRSQAQTLEDLARHLQTTPGEVLPKAASLLTELAAEHKRVVALQRELFQGQVEALAGQAQRVNGVPVVAAQVSAATPEALRELGDLLKRRLGSAVIVLGTVWEGRPSFMAMVTPDLVAQGYHAGRLIRSVAQVTGGSGGGRPELAQAGGRSQERLQEALRLVPKLLPEATPPQADQGRGAQPQKAEEQRA